MKREIPREIHLWKNVRKGLIGSKNLLKKVKFQTLQLKICLKRINPPKLQKFNRQKETWYIRSATAFSYHKTNRCKKNICLSLSARASMFLSPRWFAAWQSEIKGLKGLLQSDSPPNVETMIAYRMFLIRLIRRCRTYRLS